MEDVENLDHSLVPIVQALKKIPQILGGTRGDHYRKFSPFIVQEKKYCTDASKIQE
jgi:hypothetical protein